MYGSQASIKLYADATVLVYDCEEYISMLYNYVRRIVVVQRGGGEGGRVTINLSSAQHCVIRYLNSQSTRLNNTVLHMILRPFNQQTVNQQQSSSPRI